MKTSDAMLAEYVKRVSDEDLSFLRGRFRQDLCGDKAEALNILSKDRELDKWLSTATSADEFFDMIDVTANFVCTEYNRRNENRKR